MLQDRINKITEYFRGMEITNNTYIIKVAFKDKWGVFPSEDNRIKVCKSEDTINEFFYYANFLEVNVDDIFDLIEETIDMNISAEMKINLLTAKIDELKVLFTDEPLERLQTLYFGFQDNNKLQSTKKKYRKKKKVEEVKQDVVETSDIIENNEPLEAD